MSEEVGGFISWTPVLEDYFASTGERAHCLSWIHGHAAGLYERRRTWIDLPSIIGSAAIGFLNGASTTIFPDPAISSMALGVGSLVVGLLSTIGTYFGWAKRAESHRLASIHYAKLHRFIRVELSLPRDERMRVADLLKMVKDAYDRLAETSPLVPAETIREFRGRFSGTNYDEVSKPEIANGLEQVKVFTGSMNKEESRLRVRIPESAPGGSPVGMPVSIPSSAHPERPTLRVRIPTGGVDRQTERNTTEGATSGTGLTTQPRIPPIATPPPPRPGVTSESSSPAPA